MLTAWADYYVFPRIVPAGKETTITLVPRGNHAAFAEGEQVRIMLLPMENSLEPEKENDEYPALMFTGNGGGFSFSWTFEGEQEHLIRIDRYVNGQINKRRRTQLSVYSLLPDLYATRPYRGDLHVHTCFSDGREFPDYVVANYRKAGFDFMAITDHHRWDPSEMAIQTYREIPTGIRLYHGEEVHAPGNHTHIVNFGGDFSVNRLFEENPEMFEREVNALADTLGELPEGVNRFEYAANVWLFDRIREAGGLAIFPHPHWIANVYHVRDAMTWHLFRTKPFDAFEVLGGQSQRENNMQWSIYNEARAQGLQIPIVGSSDSHGTTNANYFTEESTMVFAADAQRDTLIEAIKDFRSVAVSAYKGEVPVVHGPYRMAKYAMFLLDAYFPQHDELCAIEGAMMHMAIEGDEWAKKTLGEFQSKVDEFREKCFA